MTPLVFFGIVFLLCALILCVGACMRSSQISRREEDQAVRTYYYELLYSVETKHPDETRHETALRYIRERENQQRRVSMSAEQENDS